MANELTLNATFSYSKSGTVLSLKPAVSVDVSGSVALHNRQSVGTSEEALQLGDVTSLGYCIVINRDATNFVEVRPGTGVADLVKVRPGKFVVLDFADGVTAPYVVADTAAVEIEYVLLSV